MKSTEEIVGILRAWKPEAVARYGVTSLGLFGSCARGQQHDGSDIDVCFNGDTPSLVTIGRMETELEALTGSKVQMTMIHDGLSKRLRDNINRDVIYV